MYTNTCLTLYNRDFDENGREKWWRVVLRDVFWEERGGANFGKNGMEPEEKLRLFIPDTVDAMGLTYLEPKAYAKATNRHECWTLRPEDRIVRGEADILDAREAERELDGVFRVSRVRRRQFGRESMWHWEVAGR